MQQILNIVFSGFLFLLVLRQLFQLNEQRIDTGSSFNLEKWLIETEEYTGIPSPSVEYLLDDPEIHQFEKHVQAASFFTNKNQFNESNVEKNLEIFLENSSENCEILELEFGLETEMEKVEPKNRTRIILMTHHR